MFPTGCGVYPPDCPGLHWVGRGDYGGVFKDQDFLVSLVPVANTERLADAPERPFAATPWQPPRRPAPTSSPSFAG